MKNENTDNSPLHVVGEIGRNACNITLLAALSAAVGFIAGILSAPKPGKELRKDFEEKSHQFMDKAKEQINKLNKKFHPENNYEDNISMVR